MNLITNKIVDSAWGIFLSTMRQYQNGKATSNEALSELVYVSKTIAELLNVDDMELRFRLESMLMTTIKHGMKI